MIFSIKGRVLVVLMVVFCLRISSSVYSQSTQVGVDSLVVAMRNIQSNFEQAPPSVNDTAYSNIKVELNLQFYISNLSQLSAIELKYGSALGKGNIADVVLTYSKIGGKDFLVFNNQQFEIVKNKVTLTRQVPQSLVTKTGYLTIRTKDLNNIFSTVFSKKFN